MTRVGRPVGPAADTAVVVLTAALDLLLAEGGPALTAQRLHQVTGVSRSTIYRHWATPTDVLAALIDVAPGAEHPLTADRARDLHAEVDALCDRLRDKPVGAFLQALVAMAASDPAAVALRQRYVDDLVAPFRRALSHDSDVPPAAVDAVVVDAALVDDVVSAVVSPLLVDALLLDRPVQRERAHRAVDLHLKAAAGQA